MWTEKQADLCCVSGSEFKQQQKLPWQELHCLNSESRFILFNIRFIVNELTALEA